MPTLDIISRKMKDSGIERIGKIPEGWHISRLKNLCTSFSTNLSLQDVQPTGKYEVWGAGGLVGYLNTFCCETQYLGIVKDGAGIGRIKKYEAKTSLLGTMAYIIPNDNIDIDWLKFVIGGIDFENDIGITTIPHIYFSVYGKKQVCFIPLGEQRRIAAYLDARCGEIDKVMAKTRESIEEYKKLKQSVITEAVTKGIRGDRPMKPSGIEWIGDIPAEWEVRPFRTVLIERNEKNSPAQTEERLSLSIDIGVTKYAEKTTNLDRFKEDVTQYKLAYPGDLVMNSMNMIVGAVGISPYFGCVSPAYYTYHDQSASKSAARFCDFLFRTKIMRRVLHSLGKGIYSIERGDDRVNTCRLKVAREDLRALKIPLPCSMEQAEIISYLDQRCTEIDRLITKKERIITELENYKKSLIYECVTGKREVC